MSRDREFHCASSPCFHFIRGESLRASDTHPRSETSFFFNSPIVQSTFHSISGCSSLSSSFAFAQKVEMKIHLLEAIISIFSFFSTHSFFFEISALHKDKSPCSKAINRSTTAEGEEDDRLIGLTMPQRFQENNGKLFKNRLCQKTRNPLLRPFSILMVCEFSMLTSTTTRIGHLRSLNFSRSSISKPIIVFLVVVACPSSSERSLPPKNNTPFFREQIRPPPFLGMKM